MLAQHLMECIGSISGRRTKPSRSACAQLAVQVLVVAAGLRRAALVDALSLTVDQASAFGTRLAALSQLPESYDLREVRLLFHAPTSQTFILSRRQSLWTDVLSLTNNVSLHPRPEQVLWVDVRLTAEHQLPSLSAPDTHGCHLIAAVHISISEDDSGDMLVVSQSHSAHNNTLLHSRNDAQLVGVALAGFLLEYGAIYCIHDLTSRFQAEQIRYEVRPFRSLEQAPIVADFAASPTNCLGMQPLILFRVMWYQASDSQFELLAFSIPQCFSSDEDTQHRRASLLKTFQARASNVSASSIFASGQIAIDTSRVTLSQVAL